MDIKDIVPYFVVIGFILGLARYFYTILGSVKDELYKNQEKREKEIRRTLDHERQIICSKIEANSKTFNGHSHDDKGRIILGRQ